MKDRREALYKILERIKQFELLLPDFQREFVWKEEERQCALVASVLAKLPIGDILLLATKNPNEYACKILGSRNKVPKDKLIDGKEVSFLLDGQQRLTVLATVFSDTIFDLNKNNVSSLISDKLKRRFFLKFPKFGNFNINDPFGLWDLKFTIDDPKNPEPSFVSSDMLPIVDVLNFTVTGADKNASYNPYNDDVMKLNSLTPYNSNSKFTNCFALPLFLLDNSQDRKMILNKIIKEIADNVLLSRKKLIKILLGLEETNELMSENSKEDFIKRAKQFYGYALNDDGKLDLAKFLEQEKKDSVLKSHIIKYDENADKNKLYDDYIQGLEFKQSYWITSMEEYLRDCVDRLNLRQLILEETERRRAIDIFENMNRGGVKLDIFDLIMAKVASVSTIAFNERLKSFINDGKDLTEKNKKCCFNYPLKLIPDKIRISYDKIKSDYLASNNLNCIDNQNNIVVKYKDAFLNVLSLIVYKNKYITKDFLDGKAEGFKLEVIKEDKKLNIEPKEIFKYCKDACVAMDRALYFFQIRCGIRSINEINYALMIPLVAYILHDKKYYSGSKSEKVFNLLEAWYWASIFSGVYDRNQNVVMMADLNNLIKNINQVSKNTKADLNWLRVRIDNILNAQDFSDENFMTYEKAAQGGEIPKNVMKSFVCQYYLSCGYYDLIKAPNSSDAEFLNVFCSSSNSLEMHHVIPLGTAPDIKTSTKKLRADPKHYLNSPLNMLYISKNANNAISDKSLETYSKNLPIESTLEKVGFTKTDLDLETAVDIQRGPLKNRHKSLRSAVTGEAKGLISNL